MPNLKWSLKYSGTDHAHSVREAGFLVCLVKAQSGVDHISAADYSLGKGDNTPLNF